MYPNIFDKEYILPYSPQLAAKSHYNYIPVIKSIDDNVSFL